MALEKFSLASLATIDSGRVKVAFDQALRRVEEDCRDRPIVDTARKVTITAIIKPNATEAGELASCDLRVEISDNLPKRQSQTYNMASTPGGLLYDELSPEDVDQKTLELTEPREVDTGRTTEEPENKKGTTSA